MHSNSNEITLFPIFARFPELLAFSTTRHVFSEDSPVFTGKNRHVVRRREQLSGLLGISSECMVFPEQTHSANVAVLDKPPEGILSDTDAVVTGKTGICLCVQTADCVPVVLYDPLNRVIAAIHAGWRGTCQHIVRNTILAMKNRFACDPGNICAAIGPAIGLANYETGDEVAVIFRKEFPDPEKFLNKKPNGRWHLDLCEANRLELLKEGLHLSGIQLTGHCTFQRNDLYYSVRRDGSETGRMVTGIMIQSLQGQG
jgi:polyphenol oxidase